MRLHTNDGPSDPGHPGARDDLPFSVGGPKTPREHRSAYLSSEVVDSHPLACADSHNRRDSLNPHYRDNRHELLLLTGNLASALKHLASELFVLSTLAARLYYRYLVPTLFSDSLQALVLFSL